MTESGPIWLKTQMLAKFNMYKEGLNVNDTMYTTYYISSELRIKKTLFKSICYTSGWESCLSDVDSLRRSGRCSSVDIASLVQFALLMFSPDIISKVKFSKC